MDLRKSLHLLRRRWRILAICVLLATAGAIVLTLLTPRSYTARAQFFVSAQEPAGSDISSAYTGGLFTQQRVKSYVRVVQSTRVGALVRSEIRSQESAEAISARISASAPLDTVLINVAAVDRDPRRAQAIVTAIGKTFPQLVEQIERPAGGGDSPVKVSVVEPASLPTSPTSPRAPFNLGLGVILGLAAGVGVAVLRDALDSSITGPDEVRGLVGAPILGAINFDPDASKRPLVVVTAPSSARAESFRQLRTNLQFVDIEHPLRSVVFTSSVPGEGKSTTTCNLAITLTQAGLRVVLIEGDLRRPRIADYMGMEGAVGLTSVLLGRTTLDDALQPWGDGSLQVLASGPLPPNPSELLGSQGMQDLLRELERRADIVIIDAPPLLPVTDAAVLGTLTSGLVMLVRSNSTTREQVAGAVATVQAVGGVMLGAVLNMVPTKGPNSYSYGYGYSYSYKPAAGSHRLLDHESPVGEARRHDVPREDGKPDKPTSADAQPQAAPTHPTVTPGPHPVLAEVLSEYSAPVVSPIPPWEPDLLEPMAPAPAPVHAPPQPVQEQTPAHSQGATHGQAPAVTPTGHVTTVYPDGAEAPGPRTDPAPDQRG